MEWTKEQKEAIEGGGENILLSAAAGSGKTAVLVQRIIDMITDEKKGVDVNRLLILTFTEAAAKEMKNKISDAIEANLEKAPSDAKLKRQRLLLSSANISTVHAFCLETLKANIHLTDIPMDFTICSQSERDLILAECIDKILSEYYLRLDKLPPFRALADGYGGKKSDAELRNTLTKLYDFAASMPNPIKWLNQTAAEHKKVCMSNSIISTVWEKELKRFIYNEVEQIEELLGAELSFCEEYLDDTDAGIPHKYTAFFSGENARIHNALMKVKHELEFETERKYDRIHELFESVSFERLPSVSTKNCPEMKPFMERAKLYRANVKDKIKAMRDMLSMSESVMVKRIRVNCPRVKTLKNLVIRIMRRFKKEKLKKNLLDFNDLEHEMLNLICDKNGAPTETADILRERYIEILVDEYQDTNYIQDAIFKVISRNNKNIFMVGDMKQSIYMFRNAVPGLFLDKYKSYSLRAGQSRKDGKSGGRLIRLNRNFRSRRDVVDSVNFIFENLMSERLGNINYNSDEKLIAGADYPECENGMMNTELTLIHNTGESGLDNYTLEAKAAALKIKELIKTAEVTDKENGKLRGAEYKDIVILIRNANNLSPVYEAAFAEQGIPIYTGMGRTYLSSVEVRMVLSFLQIADNPYQDIPLIAVMRSPMFAFSADELAEIRSCGRTGYFYDALLEAAKLNKDGKAAKFLKELMSIRTKNEFSDIHSIIWDIYYKYNYFSIVGAMDNGGIRQENLRLLYNRALEFENGKFEGLFGFMNYIDGLLENGKDLTAVGDVGGANRVTLMSIHKSKGLEFPIVLLCGTSNQFNTKDLSRPIIWDNDLGISLDCYDGKIRAFYPSPTSEIMKRRMADNLISEELRLLYVALTRAKERLIIFAPIGERNNSWKKLILNENGGILNAYSTGLNSMRDWILSAFLLHRDARELRALANVDESVVNLKYNFNVKFGEKFEEDILKADDARNFDKTGEKSLNTNADFGENNDIPDEAGETINDEELLEISENLFKDYKYKALGEIPTKISVTELKRMRNAAVAELDVFDGDEYEVNLFDADGGARGYLNINLSDNYSIADNFNEIDDLTFKRIDEISGTDRGTIIHFVMQHMDFSKAATKESVVNQIGDMVRRGVINERQAEVVESRTIVDFAKSDLCVRMVNSGGAKREFKFYTTISADKVYTDADKTALSGETILMQGIVDCFFEEDGELVIIDYKTDRISGEGIIKYSERYRAQLEYYQAALENIFGKKVKEKYLYYLECSRCIEIR